MKIPTKVPDKKLVSLAAFDRASFGKDEMRTQMIFHRPSLDLGTQKGMVMVSVMLLLIIVAWPLGALLTNTVFIVAEQGYWYEKMALQLNQNPLDADSP